MNQASTTAAMQGGGAGAVALMVATWIHILLPDLGLTDVQIGITAAGLAAIIAFAIRKAFGPRGLGSDDNPASSIAPTPTKESSDVS